MVLPNGFNFYPKTATTKPVGKPKPPEQPTPWGWATTPDFTISNIGLREILRAYRLIGYPRCPYYCKRNCKKNPYCLWGLGNRNWEDGAGTNGENAKESEEEPETNGRGENEIVGIQNLGNTCYVNSLLQLWFHNPIICPTVLRWRPPPKESGEESNSNFVPCCAISHLQAMFARMKISKRKAIDARPFVDALQLDAAEQQDAQEFSKLLMQKIIENPIENNNKISKEFKNCFTGESQFETVCEKCHNKSVGGKEEFTELTLPVKKTLDEALQEVCWQESKLENDNQYFCTKCNGKQDATRSMKVLKLPQVLNIQLLRFVYDSTVGDRRKVQKSIEFPEILDMTGFVPEEYRHGQDFVYQLNAVLIHHGRRVSQGHYIAHIKDVKSGLWFECNDDSIAKIDKKKYSNKKLTITEEGAGASGSASSSSGTATSNPSSTGAYMLVYTRQKDFVPPNPDPEVPDYLKQIINQEDLEYEKELNLEKACKEEAVLKKVERQSIIETLFQPLVPSPIKKETNAIDRESNKDKKSNDTSVRDKECKPKINGNTSRAISSSANHVALPILQEEARSLIPGLDFLPVSWMEKWLDSKVETVPILHTDEFICEHKKMKPPKRNDINILYKVVPSSFADRIYEQYSLPTVQRLKVLNSMCNQCISLEAQLIHDLATLDSDFKDVQRLIKEVDNSHATLKLKDLTHLPEEFTEDKLWIGKETLRTWKKYARMEIEHLSPAADDECEEMVENFVFNSDILCEHGQLSRQISSRKLIDLQAWSILTKYFPDAIMYGYQHETCKECMNSEAVNSVVVQQNKELAQRQRHILNELYLNKSRPTPLSIGTYYLVPTSFVHEWRRFIKEPANNDSIGIVPTTQLLCTDDDCSCVKPSLKYTAEAWHMLSEVYTLTESDSKITLIRESEMVILRDQMEFEIELKVNITIDPVTEIRVYTYNVGICEQSVENWVDSIANEAYVYNSGNVYIKLIDDEYEVLSESNQGEPPAKREKLDLTNFTVGPSRRNLRDRGSRHTRTAQCYKSLDSNMTIRDFQILNLTKDYKAMLCDQHLYFNNRELNDSDKRKTFGELKVSSNSTIFLRIDKPNGNGQDDYGERDVPSQTERGFLGTALASTFPVPVVQNGTSPSLNLC